MAVAGCGTGWRERVMPPDANRRPTVVAGADPAVIAAVGRQVRADGPLIAVGPAMAEGFTATAPVGGGRAGWDEAAAHVLARWGTPRVMITCPSPVPRRHLANSDSAGWQAALDGNLGPAVAACRAFAPTLRGCTPATIIMLAWEPSEEPGQVHLAAASGAVQLFALALAADLGSDGITVNAVTVGENDLDAVGPVLELLSLPHAGYVNAEVLRVRAAR